MKEETISPFWMVLGVFGILYMMVDFTRSCIGCDEKRVVEKPKSQEERLAEAMSSIINKPLSYAEMESEAARLLAVLCNPSLCETVASRIPGDPQGAFGLFVFPARKLAQKDIDEMIYNLKFFSAKRPELPGGKWTLPIEITIYNYPGEGIKRTIRLTFDE